MEDTRNFYFLVKDIARGESSQVNINQLENIQGGIDSTIDGYTILITLGLYDEDRTA